MSQNGHYYTSLAIYTVFHGALVKMWHPSRDEHGRYYPLPMGRALQGTSVRAVLVNGIQFTGILGLEDFSLELLGVARLLLGDDDVSIVTQPILFLEDLVSVDAPPTLVMPSDQAGPVSRQPPPPSTRRDSVRPPLVTLADEYVRDISLVDIREIEDV